MRKAMFLMLITALVTMSSCSKKDQTTSTTSQTTQATSLPANAATYVVSNYPDATIDYVLLQAASTARFIVGLNTTEELAFNNDGGFMGNGKGHHDGGHPGDTIYHDSTGCGGGHHGGGHHGGGHHGGPHGIPIDSLSSVIKDYISTNFPGDTIMHAEYDSLCVEGLVTEVMIGQSGLEPVKLIFSGTGAFLLQASRINYTDTPQAVKDYITANYSTYELCDKAEKYTMADGSLQYVVYLHLARVRISVRLKSDGTLICTR